MLRFRSRAQIGCVLISFIFCLAIIPAAPAGEGKGKRKKLQQAAEQKKAGKEGMADIPLPIGHEAKGVVIPDYDLSGHLINNFDAGIAKRIDDVHVQLRDLKMTTYTADNKVDLHIDMKDSVLDMKTRVISSKTPTTVRRTDFTIIGDTMQFNTTTRQGTLVGHVKMVITGQTHLMPKAAE